jgi:hypothetical protein
MKKLVILFLIVIFLGSGLFTSAQDSIDYNKKLEVSEYYGYLSLLINVHTEIWRWEASDKTIFFSVWLLNEMKYYSDLDVIKYLWSSFDIEKSLNWLLYDINDVANQWSVAISQLKKSLLFLKDKKTNCDSLKEISDKDFSLALKDLDSKSMEISLNKSIENQKCSSDARIYYNVQDKILKEIEFYYEILDYKYNYFYGNRFDIIKNYPNIVYNLNKIK